MYQLIVLAAAALLVAADQWAKVLVVRFLYPPADPIPLWDGVLEFCYTENRGVAWGMLQNSRLLVIVFTVLMMAAILAVLMSGRLRKNMWITVGATLVLSGGVGNLVDRLVRGYVIDFIHYYKWFDFPVFNVADILITVGAVLILVYCLFIAKDTPKEAKDDGTVLSSDESVGDGMPN